MFTPLMLLVDGADGESRWNEVGESRGREKREEQSRRRESRGVEMVKRPRE